MTRKSTKASTVSALSTEEKLALAQDLLIRRYASQHPSSPDIENSELFAKPAKVTPTQADLRKAKKQLNEASRGLTERASVVSAEFMRQHTLATYGLPAYIKALQFAATHYQGYVTVFNPKLSLLDYVVDVTSLIVIDEDYKLYNLETVIVALLQYTLVLKVTTEEILDQEFGEHITKYVKQLTPPDGNFDRTRQMANDVIQNGY